MSSIPIIALLREKLVQNYKPNKRLSLANQKRELQVFQDTLDQCETLEQIAKLFPKELAALDE
jgi:hypothetical protein